MPKNGVPSPSPRVMLELGMALTAQHNLGGTGRAAGLVEPIAAATSPDLLPWCSMARLLASRIAEQRRLEDLIERQAAQRKDTQQRSAATDREARGAQGHRAQHELAGAAAA